MKLVDSVESVLLNWLTFVWDRLCETGCPFEFFFLFFFFFFFFEIGLLHEQCLLTVICTVCKLLEKL